MFKLVRSVSQQSKARPTLFLQVQCRTLARKKKSDGNAEKSMVATETAPPPASNDPWEAVVDKQSGLVYWWNTQTNETTALGAPKPGTMEAYQQQQQNGLQQGGGGGGLGRAVAEGFAFGTGAGIARGVIGSFFGGGSDDGGGDSNGGSGGDDGWI